MEVLTYMSNRRQYIMKHGLVTELHLSVLNLIRSTRSQK